MHTTMPTKTTLTPDAETRVRRNTHRIVGHNPAHSPCLHPLAYGYLLTRLITGSPRFSRTTYPAGHPRIPRAVQSRSVPGAAAGNQDTPGDPRAKVEISDPCPVENPCAIKALCHDLGWDTYSETQKDIAAAYFQCYGQQFSDTGVITERFRRIVEDTHEVVKLTLGKLYPYQRKELFPALARAFYLHKGRNYHTLAFAVKALEEASYHAEAAWLKPFAS